MQWNRRRVLTYLVVVTPTAALFATCSVIASTDVAPVASCEPAQCRQALHVVSEVAYRGIYASLNGFTSRWRWIIKRETNSAYMQESCFASGVRVGISNFRHMVGLFECLQYYLLANVTCYRPSVCLSSVTLVRPTQAIYIFGNISTALGTLPWQSTDIRWKFHGDRPRGTPAPEELNTRWVAKYSGFGPIDGYISETVQDRR